MAKKDATASATVNQPKTEVVEVDNTWKDDPKAKIRRVFRATDPLTKVEIATLSRKKRIIGGNEYPAQFLTITVNHVAQYILADTFEDDEYQEQLVAMRKYEKMGRVIEMPTHWEGTLYVEPAPLTPSEARAAELLTENEALLARIKELEERSKINE